MTHTTPQRRADRDSGRTDRRPRTPTDLPKRSWGGALKRTLTEARDDNVTDWAAALTYFGVLAIFPALLVMVSVLGMVGTTATQPLIDNLGAVAPGPAQEILTGALQSLQQDSGAAGVLFFAGLAGALWSASAYVAAFTRASNAVYGVEESRPLWKTLPLRVVVTVVLLVLLVVSAVAVVFTGGLAQQLGGIIGVSDTALTVWSIAKWPALVLVVATMLALLYWVAPNVRQPGVRWITPGALVAILLWIAASAAFAFYVANFGSYNKTYGAVGGVIVFLLWLWITNLAVLLGLELDAELRRARSLEAGRSDDPPRAQPRDTRKFGQG